MPTTTHATKKATIFAIAGKDVHVMVGERGETVLREMARAVGVQGAICKGW
jgi:hypothetical protein